MKKIKKKKVAKKKAAKKAAVRKKATFEGLRIRCPKTNKLVTIPAKKVEWECEECCGSRYIETTVTCSCKKSHDIVLVSD